MTKHFIIPDVQAKTGVSLEHLTYIGKYILDKKPDVIICIGDFADMESLSSYDIGKRCFENRRYLADISSATEAMNLLLAPMRGYNKHQQAMHRQQYRPRMVLTLGNHEERIARVGELQPHLDGVIGYLTPIEIDGISYVHYLANPMTGKPYGGNALNQLTKVGKSFIVGHKQTLDVATRFTLDGSQQWGIIAGAAYTHNENYKGPQGNAHWRGCIMIHRVQEGSFDPMFISLDYLKDRYNV